MSPTHRQRHAAPRSQSQAGFTLLEVVAAFSILALGLAMAMQAASGAMTQSRIAAEQTHAALLAQTVMDTLGAVEPLEEGDYRGEFDDGYRWHASVTPYELQEQADDLSNLAQAIELFRVDLEVEWQRGERPVSARFSTLRAMYRRND